MSLLLPPPPSPPPTTTPLQKDLMAVLISQGDVRAANLKSAVLKALEGDEAQMNAVEQ